MENLWTKISNRVPQYFESVSRKYELSFAKISELKTAIVGNKFAIIISIGRFDVDVFYATKVDDKKEVLQCGNFLAERYTDEDRQGLLEGEGAENIVLNNLKVIASGIENKWAEILRGETKWIENFRDSKWYSTVRLTQEEENVLWKLI
ncbi:MAG: hypothetical protein K2O73_08230 [Lachnospiraceae bacterium]|nr:hypothetical protein [Lachnospiraceae bacterium]